MKGRKWIAIVLCLAVLGLVFYLASVSGEFSNIDSPETLGSKLGWMSLVPPLLAVVLAFLLRNVMVSLLLGYVSGVAMLTAIGGAGLWRGAVLTFYNSCRGIVETATDVEKATVLILCIFIGGMVEVIRSSGGFEALAAKLTKRINTVRRANLVGELLGLIVFFDDYANSLIVGPVMQPITDKLNISREKLAYIVDSTAAPVTGIAIISSWVAVEVSVINEGFALAGIEMSGYSAFLKSIPYCFYCIFCLVFMFESSMLRREFGPMLHSEIRARSGETLRKGSNLMLPKGDSVGPKAADKQGRRITVAVVPIILLLAVSFVSFYTSGRANAIAAGTLAADAPLNLSTIATAFGSSDTIFLVMAASAAAGIVAIILGSVFKLFNFKEGQDTWVNGASSIMFTVFILVLAWSLSLVVNRLGTVYFVVDIISLNVPWWLVPTLIFLSSCLMSFAVGSYGCMFIAMPMAIPIVKAVIEAGGVKNPDTFLLLCIASVLSGSIFGDHASPITDCTILSSMGAGCDNMDHVKTQLPYTITIAAVSVLCGTLLSALGLSVWLCLPIGFAVLAAVLLIFGKNPDEEYAKKSGMSV